MEPVTTRRWKIREAEQSRADLLVRECAIHPLVARLLVNRGVVEPGVARRFMGGTLADIHDPFLLRGMEQAVVRLAAAVATGEPICIYGDYDVDGITSVALLVSFFRALGAAVFYHIPLRLEEGYGLSAEGIAGVAEQGARVIVSVDCGITAVAEAELCRQLGVDLIITDHHTPGEVIPPAYAVINPHQPECPFPFKFLAGVGVAFNLLIALRSRLRDTGHFASRPEPNLREYLDLVALGTIADIVPLIDENRIFVSYGLRELSASTRPGIQALKTVAGVDDAVTCGAVGFRLAPRLNAAGRLEDAALGVDLLLSGDRQRSRVMAESLDDSNTERQALEQQILRDALTMVKGEPGGSGRKSIVLASDAWHPGVIGIVASRLVDLFHRPTILIALQDGNGRGSGRSIPGFHLHDALCACADLLVKFGGHKYAAGLSIDEATLEKFVADFEAVADGLLATEDLLPELAIDAEIAPDDLTLQMAEQLESLAPFGMGNPEPVFVLRGMAVTERRLLKERHLKMRLSAGGRIFNAIGFNMAGRDDPGERCDVAFSFGVNVWKGKKSLQLRLKDFKMAEG
ncbi:single-stranded-DNA-specific exonuclease RecJ [Geobacter sp. AOG1]|uniref:single-stranded-DNA-specific exonuclease RecJ n=1 Tax=Geobacter sp. AOG1 TaxID=1566346 RepID=UPI001CC5C508|nr:single-stranded-DNA-specific exonuclease RecJ [Geobacter sp. AOG1]